jgi:hypothetical protein
LSDAFAEVKMKVSRSKNVTVINNGIVDIRR